METDRPAPSRVPPVGGPIRRFAATGASPRRCKEVPFSHATSSYDGNIGHAPIHAPPYAHAGSRKIGSHSRHDSRSAPWIVPAAQVMTCVEKRRVGVGPVRHGRLEL